MKRLFFIASIVIGAYFLNHIDTAAPSPLSKPGEPIALYSTQAGDHLQDTLTTCLENSKKSIVLMIYTLKDRKILETLNRKAKEGVDVKIIYDAKASLGVEKKLAREIKKVPRDTKGLMHLKIFVIDDREVFLGSTNMTYDSLRSHDNLLAHFHDQDLAGSILEKARQLSLRGHTPPVRPAISSVGTQTVELSFLPDDKTALPKVKKLIQSANKTVKVAMYTFTRNDLADELCKAKQRGLDVQVIIDRSASNGSSKKLVSYLKEKGLTPRISSGEKLMHNKFLIVDDKILVHGSANWTKQAFLQNDDFIMIMYDLNPSQVHTLQKIWNTLEKDAA